MTRDDELLRLASENSERLARVEENLKNLTGWLQSHTRDDRIHRASLEDEKVRLIAESTDAHSAIGDRLANLELWRAKIAGIAATAGVVSGVVTGLVVGVILHFFPGA